MQDGSEARWDDVRVFLAAHRHGSLGAAARRLGLDTSTMSRRLSALEGALGARLFERTRDGLLPTRVAESILPAAEAMEAAHGQLSRDASDVELAAEGTVRLSAAPGMADVFIAPLLVRLRERHPRITIELDASVRPLDLTRREADLALRSISPQGAELVITKIGTARWVAAGAVALVRALGPVASWSDVPWITWDRDMASFGPARWIARHAARADIALRTSHFTSQLVAAETGLGLALLPEPYLRARGLGTVRHADTLAASVDAWPSDDLWLVTHRVLRGVPRVAAVWAFLAEALREVMAPERRARAPGRKRR